MHGTRVVMEYAEVKAKWLSVYAGDSWRSQHGMRRSIGNWQKGGGGFYGATSDQMVDWIRNGFQSPEFPVGEEYEPHRPSRKLEFGEEGELDLQLAWSGYDYPYLAWQQQDRKPGIRIEAQFNWSAGVQPKTIAQYGAWLAGVLSGLESQGYDLELDLANYQTQLYANTHGQNVTVVRVKKENELSDFSDWSALFSPGGFRMLFFTALGMGGDKLGKRVNSTLGLNTEARVNTVEYNAEDSTLYIKVDSRLYGDFPMEDMTQKVKDALSI